jgi:hypothetical protein
MTGLAVWGYQLLMRDVTGVPVVRALEGPMRVAPDDPGGEQADYQGLSVTQVAVDGAVEVPIERVVLAPAPVRLEDEDQPVAALIPDTPSATPESTEVAQARPKSAIELALAEALGQTVEDVTHTGAKAATEGNTLPTVETSSGGESASIIEASVAGVAQSPRPAARPAKIQNAVAMSTSASAAEPLSGEVEVPPDQVPAGTRLVQLGAYPSVEGAREAWAGLEKSFGDYFAGKNRVVEEAAAGGSTFYRLRAMGFEDLSDARRFCSVLVADSANCIPVIRR